MQFRSTDSFLSGLVVPLGALRSAASPACGEYPDLELMGELAASWNFKLIQLLPVNDSGSQSSPYSALSAFALHPLYIRIGDLPEASLPAAAPFLESAGLLAEKHRNDPRLAYGEYLEAKVAILEGLFRAIYGRRPEAMLDKDPSFASWLADNPWVPAYSVFSELKRRHGGLPWWSWPEHRDPGATEIRELWAETELIEGTRFRAWLQMRGAEQFSRASRALAERGVELMGDIPILISADSAEVWARRSVFRLDLKAGAPPDMYAGLGQNWGFPIYDWEALAKEDYSFWRERLEISDRFYSAYRIDHVLGFFRIWALGQAQTSGYLGRFVPDAEIGRAELEALGFDAGRIRWLSEPHISTHRLVEACGDETAAMEAQEAALDRIGDEELFLFKRRIHGEGDIEELSREGLGGWGGVGLAPAARDFLLSAYRDRVLYEFEKDRFVPTWSYSAASAWPTLSDEERRRLESLFSAKRAEGETLWEETGRRLLGFLKNCSAMLPCAEDLGSVPACVPRVLEELGILGLRVLRWARDWGSPGQPFTPLADYPRLSVACPSVHDSSSLREWWEAEADRRAVWDLAARSLGEPLGEPPEGLDPGTAEILFRALAASNSSIVVYPIQDLLNLGDAWREKDPKNERINVPGTTNEWNWGYRLPGTIEKVIADESLAHRVRSIPLARPH